MITDFPEVKKEIRKTVDAVLRQKVKENAVMLSMVSTRTLYEGDKIGVLHPDGQHMISDLLCVESEFSIPRKNIPNMKPDDLMSKVSGAAKDMAGQIEKNIFKKIDESIKLSGNIIPGNPELSPNSVLSGLEMMFIEFEDDDRTKPIKPSIVAHPDAVKKLMELESKATPEEKIKYQEREKIILDKKYEEYIKDIESRKIVD